ncbi:hypothetical protein ABTY00_05645 [Streptomyces microflavus]|uniref:hypothetical protein n=1 Tax=Streptomyces microflavus TaxID=1919 RepID=UPI00331AD7BA
MTSDITVGGLLSGGLDSTIATAATAIIRQAPLGDSGRFCGVSRMKVLALPGA